MSVIVFVPSFSKHVSPVNCHVQLQSYTAAVEELLGCVKVGSVNGLVMELSASL